MRNSRDGIITSHVGSLPRPDELIAANRARDQGTAGDEAGFQKLLQSSVSDIVKRQLELGIAVPNDGEFGKSMGQQINYRAWLSYIFHRLDGIEVGAGARINAPPRRARADDLIPVDLMERRDRAKFMRAYTDPDHPISTVRNAPRNRSAPARSNTTDTQRSRATSRILRARWPRVALRRGS
jgi:5-methyltetrahydropteroyltriglutamate--homocysteine methyltransferase